MRTFHGFVVQKPFIPNRSLDFGLIVRFCRQIASRPVEGVAGYAGT